MRLSTPLRWLAAAGALAACGEPEPGTSPPDPTPADGAPTATPAPERAAAIERTLSIEGMDEPMRFRLVRAPDAFPIPFSTYVPADMDASFDATGSGHAAHFSARFGGVRNDRARLTVHAYPAGTSLDRARTELAAYLSGLVPDDTPLARGAGYERGTPIEPASRYRWAQDETRYRMPGDGPGSSAVIGRAGVGEHDGRVFYFLIEYPEEFGDGMGPRVAAIIDEWRWGSNGAPLGG
jgi:hypothetical protein